MKEYLECGKGLINLTLIIDHSVYTHFFHSKSFWTNSLY